MRSILPAILLFLFLNSSAQNNEATKPGTSEYFLKKSKTQKTTGFILLGGGVMLMGTGMVIGINETLNVIGNIGNPDSKSSLAGGAICFYTGLAASVASIPFFVSAGKNKRAAAEVHGSFKMQKLTYPGLTTSYNKMYPSLVLRIDLN